MDWILFDDLFIYLNFKIILLTVPLKINFTAFMYWVYSVDNVKYFTIIFIIMKVIFVCYITTNIANNYNRFYLQSDIRYNYWWFIWYIII